MKIKIIATLSLIILGVFVFTNVSALSYENLMSRLQGISTEVTAMKGRYDDIKTQYQSVFDALPAGTKSKAETLTENLLNDNINATITEIKNELMLLEDAHVAGATEVLTAIDELKSDARDLIEQNNDVVQDVKSGYKDLNQEQIRAAVEKVQDIMKEISTSIDTTASYNQVIGVLEGVNSKTAEINVIVENILKSDIGIYAKSLNVNMVKNLFNAAKTKSIRNVLNTLKSNASGLEGGTQFIARIDDALSKVNDIKTKLDSLNSVSQRDILLFNATQNTAIGEEIEEIEEQYVSFINKIIVNYGDDYIKETLKVAKSYTNAGNIDELIGYANKVLDYYEEREAAIKNFKVADALDYLPASITEKLGLVVALGYIDISKYNVKYLNDNFSASVNSLKSVTLEEMLAYADFVDSTLKNENKNIPSGTNASMQAYLIGVNAPRIITLNNIKALTSRIKTLLASKKNAVSKIQQAEPYVYDIYNQNIIDAVEQIMTLEFGKENKKYEFNGVNGLVTASFIKANDMLSMIGMTSQYVKFKDISGETVKTGTVMNINLSDKVYGEYTIAVLGDVYADGTVNSRDYMAIKNQIMGKETLSAINLVAANTYRDSDINSRDYMAIKNQIMEKDLISL